MLNKAAQQLGKLGGNATKNKYGKEHFSKAGKLGMQKRWGKKDKVNNANIETEKSS